MVSRVEDLTGLEFDFEAIVRQTQPDSGGNIYESRSRMWPLSRVFPYHRPVLSTSAHNIAVSWNGENPNERHIEEYVHWSVLERLKKGGKLVGRPGPYKPRYFPTETSGRVKLMTELEQKYWEARRR